jgi:ParB/Sulfiredoxin domain
MAIEWREISTLIPYARNARTHSEAQIAEIAGSIREFGFTNPVLIDPEGGIIAGHGPKDTEHKPIAISKRLRQSRLHLWSPKPR